MDLNNHKTIWIAWEKHRRTLELSRVFGADLKILYSGWPRIIKHPIFIAKTFGMIISRRPETLIVQNPSVVLSLLACFLKIFFGYKLIVDSHNSGLLPQSKYRYHLGIVYRFIQRKADLTIVTNKFLADYVKNNGGTAFVLPDKIPEVANIKKIEFNNKASILYICSFGNDEPYLELIKAAAKIKNINVFITGDYRKKKVRMNKKMTPNIYFTGYLSDNEYWSMLSSVNLAVDLTDREHCLVCGAYEAVAAGTPLVLSDTEALKNYFYKGTVFVSNNAESIHQQIITGLKCEKKLRQEIVELKKELSDVWQKRFDKFQIHIKNH